MAMVDFFLKFDGIKGESADAKHKDEINVETWSWGETHASGGGGRGGGAGAGKVAMQDFHFTMKVNTASVGLMKACTTGEHIKQAVFTGRKAGKDQQEYLTFKFWDVLVSSFEAGGSVHADVMPSDEVSFSFAKIEIDYRPQLPDGRLGTAVRFGYDLTQNKAF